MKNHSSDILLLLADEEEGNIISVKFFESLKVSSSSGPPTRAPSRPFRVSAALIAPHIAPPLPHPL